MKKRLSNLFVLGFVLFFVFGCSWVQSVQDTVQGNQNANVEDRTRDALGLKKTGIPECDEVIEILAKKSRGDSNAEESWTNKAMTELVKQQIYSYINDGANKSEKEKADMAKNCKAALGYLKEEPKMKEEPKK